MEQDVIDRLEFYDEGDGIEYEIWIDTKLQTLYKIPIVPLEVKRCWNKAEVLDETIKY
tara:strand:- start:1524 stop:1697 length:174 start_codon:yes stop_codon:yes gene_type:complete